MNKIFPSAADALKGVVKFPVRIKCATLAWFTMAQGLDEIAVAG